MSNAQPCAEKVPINLNAPPVFQLRQRIVGEDNANLQFIVQETKAKVTLRGKDSGTAEQNGADSNEPLYLYIEHPALKNLIEAKNLAKNLIETIQTELQLFLQTNQQSQQTVQIQQQPPVIQTNNQQFNPTTFPQLSCPPPTIIHQPTHIIQQQSYIPQHQIIPQNVPMQIIHQPPPTGVPIRAAPSHPIVQFQGQTLHQIQSGGQQILLNQAPTQQYQLQYIPSTNQITNAQGMPIQQPIQHFIQPQQQIQGILQPGANGQQFITVQGNATYMNQPPPNIIQHNQQQNAVFSAQPTVTMNQEDSQNDPSKSKQDGGHELKNQQNLQQLAARVVSQPPPQAYHAVVPPQTYQHQAPQQQIQQFIVNGNQVWPQQQQIQQIPVNSQIQIVAQPQTVRAGNDLVLQQNSSGQQVLTTFNPQQGGQQQFQQIQFHQATITQPPPQQHQQQLQQQQHQQLQLQQQQQQPQMNIIQSNQQNISYQQQFEQKINQTSEVQQRAGKRKFDGELEADPAKAMPKIGVGQSSGEASTQSKTRMLAMNSPAPQQQWKITLNSPGVATAGASGDPRVNQNKPGFSRNLASTQGNQVVSTAEPKKNENESNVANDSSQFMVRTGNQRFQAPQNFIHQLPPPIAQTQNGQIMSNSTMSMFEKMFQQPPPPPAAAPAVPHQYIQELSIHHDPNAYHQNNNYQQGSLTRMNSPQQHQQQQAPMGGEGNTGSVQQQQRFRQQQW